MPVRPATWRNLAMVYKESFFSKELKQAYIEKNVSAISHIKFGAFLALGAFGIFFALQTLTQSVLNDVLGSFMLPSYFSTLSVYTAFTFVCMVVYFLVHYEYLTFAEIGMNRWYLPLMMKFDPVSMILTKLFTRLVSIFGVYTLGFFGTLFLTSFLKYPLVVSYMFSLYLAGFFDLILITTVTMTLSLVIKTQALAKYAAFGAACLMVLTKSVTGYYGVTSNRQRMSNTAALFQLSYSPYLLIAGMCFAACIAFIIVYALRSAHKYNFGFYEKDIDFSPETEIVVNDGKTFKPVNQLHYIARMPKTLIDTIISILMIVLICILIAFNAIALAMSLASTGKQASLFGIIPYAFESNSMQPQIMQNDLVFFKKLTPQDTVGIRKVVLYTYNGQVGIGKITSISGNQITADAAYYPPGSDNTSLRRTITRGDITGIYVSRSRWLGAVILFANTSVGRLLFLLVPVFLIFYYNGIQRFFKLVAESRKAH